MAKKVVSVTLHKKKVKLIKHANKGKKLKSVLTKIFNYMKSDSYMFAPLAYPHSHASLPPFFPSDEVRVIPSEPLKKKEQKLMKDVEEYLKCDCYMYAPLLGRNAPTREERRKEDEGKIDHLNGSYNNPMKQNMRQLRETMKHILGENTQISTVPGKLVLSQKLK